ncbi:hypothetical protein [Paludisphaera mucosa]|uniref:Glycoside hydrolase family 42 N-terminal domain-containing protein n=1 Tax=Paludisphaera mucosa TaxID=3030827 RepID=A0ABT6F5M0_9BACT|nr:hypothetical protein [Paludisphaera mucosa]MDG3002881.1 hypothetical protein [Paludisphaera mucosa]
MRRVRSWRLLLVLLVAAGAAPARGDSSADAFNARLDALPIVDEIDPAAVAPVHQFPADVSRVAPILGRPARLLGMGDAPRVAAWVIGKGKGLKPGAAYLLEVEYPDDVPRAIFLANRGADLVRGFATGTATGDARQQYVQPSLESLAYPQTGRWQVHRTLFFLHDRFQGLYAQRDSKPGGRPFGPDDGFHVLVFQTKRLNDPRSEGAAIGKIRLRSVPDVAALYADVEFPPEGLPRRRVFFREEMADEAVSAREAVDRGVADPLDWLMFKARTSRVLGINTFAKDLMEFGFNQGWDSGDPNWCNNAQPPLFDVWSRLVPRIAAEGLDLLPYYEYKGAIGLDSARPQSLGWQRRAEKLYHGLPNNQYTPVWWTEAHNADLTDPDTLADAKRVLDRTVLAHKGRAQFAGAWFRVRDNHLPVSFADAAIARFRATFPDDPAAQAASRPALIASYEGDRKLYDRYIAWWLTRRAAFLEDLAGHLAKGLGDPSVAVLFTPWTSEQIPMLRDPGSGEHGHPVQITTDDPAWWDAFARTQPDSGWFRWALAPTAYKDVVARDAYASSLTFRERIEAPQRNEGFHSAPVADPESYNDSKRIMLTYPMGRLLTVESAALMESYRTGAGLTAIHHYTLNEDDHDRAKGASSLPFDGQVGYASVDVDRAGPYVRLLEARAVAKADPTNLGMLCASSFSTGFPAQVRRFNLAFLAVPALPSTIVPGAAGDAEVVVRAVPTGGGDVYYLVVNPSMRPKTGVAVAFPARGKLRDLVERRDLEGSAVRLDLDPGELRSYRVQSR